MLQSRNRNKVLLLISQRPPWWFRRFYKVYVATQRLVLFSLFWALSKKLWNRKSFYEIQYSQGISVEWLFLVVGRCVHLCSTGAWRHYKKSTEKNLNLTKISKKNKQAILYMEGLLYLGVVDTLDKLNICCEHCLVHCKVLSSTPPCLASPIPLWQPKISPEVAKCCCGAKSARLNTTALRNF